MGLTGILVLIALSILLILIEIFLIPGIGIAGIAGGVLMLAGIFFAYRISQLTGHFVLLGSTLAGGILTWLAFRESTWAKFSLKKELDNKIVKQDLSTLKIAMRGEAVSRIAPTGKAVFNGEIYDVKTRGEFVSLASKLEVIDFEGDYVVVRGVD